MDLHYEILKAHLDVNFYNEQVKEDFSLEQAALHYLENGYHLSLDPHPEFSSEFYMQANPDVVESGVNPFVHYIMFGKNEGRRVVTSSFVVNKARAKNWTTKDIRRQGIMEELDAVSSLEKVGSSKKAQHLLEKYIIESDFDEAYYVNRYLDILNSKFSPIDHYHQHGDSEGRQPSVFFDPKYYRKNTDVGDCNALFHYAVNGSKTSLPASITSAEDPNFKTVASALGLSSNILEEKIRTAYYNRRQRIDKTEIGDAVSKAIVLDPLIAHSMRYQIIDLGIPPYRNSRQINDISAIHNLQAQANWQRAEYVVLVPWIHMGGASRLAGRFLKALLSLYGADQVMVVSTESGIHDHGHWLPRNCRYVDFSDASKHLESERRSRVLFEFLRSLKPRHIININSKTFWDVVDRYADQISDCCKLSCYFFCNEKDVIGNWTGYPVKLFHTIFDRFHSVFTDSEYLKAELENRFCVPKTLQKKIIYLRTPTDEDYPVARRPSRDQVRAPAVFWAGRFDRQKRLDVVFKVAMKMPSVSFHLWGAPQMDKKYFERLGDPPMNVSTHAPFESVLDLNFENCDAWLYTSEWDGVPNMLIEIATLGVPLIGSVAGGTGEILQKGFSEAIVNIDDIDAYVGSIKKVLSDPQTANRKALRLREHMLEHHTAKKYAAAIGRVLKVENLND